MVKEGWRDKEMNISKNAVKKKIFTSYPNKKKKKNEKKMTVYLKMFIEIYV